MWETERALPPGGRFLGVRGDATAFLLDVQDQEAAFSFGCPELGEQVSIASIGANCIRVRRELTWPC